MKQETITLYKFSELSEDVQAKLIEKRRELNGSHLDNVDMEEWVKSNLTHADYQPPGKSPMLPPDLFEIDNIGWSLGHCQGDGVNITGSFDTPRLINMYTTGRVMSDEEAAILDLLKDEIGINIVRGHSNYSHKYTIGVGDYYVRGLIVDDYLNQISEEPESFSEEERERLEKLADTLAEAIADYGLEMVRDACDYAETLGYDYIDDQTSEERAREDLEADEEEEYMADGRKY